MRLQAPSASSRPKSTRGSSPITAGAATTAYYMTGRTPQKFSTSTQEPGWRTNLELAIAMADYIEHFYNPTRRHSALDYLTPNEFEDLHLTQPQARSS